MSQPFDLDAAVTESAEPFPFTWGGKAFELPAALDLPIERQLALIEAIDTIKTADVKEIGAVLNLVVGEEMLAQLSAARPLGARGLMKLLQEWMAHQGGDLGKSQASPASSASTVKPSKRTSPSARARRTS